jgi:hypothetical protein
MQNNPTFMNKVADFFSATLALAEPSPAGKRGGEMEGRCENKATASIASGGPERRAKDLAHHIENAKTNPPAWQENKRRNVAPMLVDSAHSRHPIRAKSSRHCQLDRRPC